MTPFEGKGVNLSFQRCGVVLFRAQQFIHWVVLINPIYSLGCIIQYPCIHWIVLIINQEKILKSIPINPKNRTD